MKSVQTNYLTPEQREVAYEAGMAALNHTGEVVVGLKSNGVKVADASALAKLYTDSTNVSPADYTTGVSAAYRMGQYSLPMTDKASDPAAKKLTDAQFAAAYKAGSKQGGVDVAAAIKRSQAAVAKIGQIGHVHYGAGVQTLESPQLKDTQRAGLYAAQMLMGTAALALETGDNFGAMKDAVCSPAGSTIQGVRALEAGGFRSAAFEAVIRAYERTLELGGHKK